MHWSAQGLYHEHVCAPDALVNLHTYFAVAEPSDAGFDQTRIEDGGDLLAELRVGVAGKDLQLSVA